MKRKLHRKELKIPADLTETSLEDAIEMLKIPKRPNWKHYIILKCASQGLPDAMILTTLYDDYILAVSLDCNYSPEEWCIQRHEVKKDIYHTYEVHSEGA